MRYTLELTEEQAEIIKISLEEYFRLRMNQWFDFATMIENLMIISIEGMSRRSCLRKPFGLPNQIIR